MDETLSPLRRHREETLASLNVVDWLRSGAVAEILLRTEALMTSQPRGVPRPAPAARAGARPDAGASAAGAVRVQGLSRRWRRIPAALAARGQEPGLGSEPAALNARSGLGAASARTYPGTAWAGARNRSSASRVASGCSTSIIWPARGRETSWRPRSRRQAWRPAARASCGRARRRPPAPGRRSWPAASRPPA